MALRSMIRDAVRDYFAPLDWPRRVWRWLTGTCARCGTLPRVARPGPADYHAQTAFLHGWCRDCGKRHNHAAAYGLARHHTYERSPE